MTRTLLDSLRLRKAEIARLREERGATDPILIIAGIAITLILLVGGSFAISGFIGNAHNLNAKGDLDRVATAQAAYLAQNDRYGALRVNINDGVSNLELQNSSIGFTPTAGNKTIVYQFGARQAGGWAAVTKSASGNTFVRVSTSSTIFDFGPGPDMPNPLPAGYAAAASSIGATAWIVSAHTRVNE